MTRDGAITLETMPMIRSSELILSVCAALVSQAFSADSEIMISKPPIRWLWGGFGFHNSEATMTGLMSEEFLNPRVLKTFLEISPTSARVFAGYHDRTKEAMDRFADYYDQTFRKAGTVTATNGVMTVALPSIFLTTDYTDRTPSPVTGVKISRGKLTWHASPDEEHCYYRVFKDGAQIASTVATSLAVDASDAVYAIKSVDRWGNVIR